VRLLLTQIVCSHSPYKCKARAPKACSSTFPFAATWFGPEPPENRREYQTKKLSREKLGGFTVSPVADVSSRSGTTPISVDLNFQEAAV